MYCADRCTEACGDTGQEGPPCGPGGHRGCTQPSRRGAGGTGFVGGWGPGQGLSGQLVGAGGLHPQSAWCSRSFRTELTPPCHGQALGLSPQPPWARAEARVSLSSMSSARRPHASRRPPQGQGASNCFLFQQGWTPGRGWNPAGRSGECLLLAQGDSWPRLRPEVAASHHSHSPTRAPPDTPLHDAATVGLPARWAPASTAPAVLCVPRAGPRKLVCGAPGLRPHGQSPTPATQSVCSALGINTVALGVWAIWRASRGQGAGAAPGSQPVSAPALAV